MKKFMLTVGALGLLSGCGSFYVIDGTGGKQVKINGRNDDRLLCFCRV